MLDKAILMITLVYSTPEGGYETLTSPTKDMRALEAVECIQLQRQNDEDLKVILKERVGQADEKGRVLIHANSQCLPISREEFAIFSSTFLVPAGQ